ncbi:MAG: acyloxyacyl hydrolase [Candidatus Binatia bacterium]|nr:acyloxyacyl hydrolase [Candidatus Binatia bacterium]
MRVWLWPDARRRICAGWMGLMLALAAPVAAREPAPEIDPASEPEPAPEPPSDLPHAHVSAGDISVGASGGFGFGFVRAPAYRGGETDDVNAIALFPQIGYRVTDRLGGDGWYAGSFEVLLEGNLLWETHPHSGFGGGAGLLLRYDLLSVPYVIPFGEIGGGMLDLDFGLDDQADGFNFSLHGGAGVRYFITPNWSASLACRWQHISNAGTTLPNDGIDMIQPLLGLSYVFDR